jgi:hypothetical protein
MPYIPVQVPLIKAQFYAWINCLPCASTNTGWSSYNSLPPRLSDVVIQCDFPVVFWFGCLDGYYSNGPKSISAMRPDLYLLNGFVTDDDMRSK